MGKLPLSIVFLIALAAVLLGEGVTSGAPAGPRGGPILLKEVAPADAGPFVLPVAMSGTRGPEVIPQQYIVVVNAGADPVAVANDHALARLQTYRAALNGFAASVPDDRLAALRADRRVNNVVPDHVVRALDAPTGINRIDAETTTLPGGTSTVCSAAGALRIAILDTGIDLDHPELNVDVPNSATFASGGPTPDDKNGHGSHVAGTAAAKVGIDTVNGGDVRGVFPGGCLVAVKDRVSACLRVMR